MSWAKVTGAAFTTGTMTFAAGVVMGSLLASGLVDGALPDLGPVRSILGAEERDAERARALEEQRQRDEEIAQQQPEEEVLPVPPEAPTPSSPRPSPKPVVPTPTTKPSPTTEPKPSTNSVSRVVDTSSGGCVDGALRKVPEDGSRVEIIGISSEDAFFRARKDYVGTKGKASGLSSSGDCYFSGAIQRDVGDAPYFYQVSVKAAAGGNSGSSCPAGALRSVSAGDPVVILAVHPDDAFHDSRSRLEGQSGVAVAPDLTEDCWWGGTIRAGDDERYFYKVALGPAAGSTPKSDGRCPSGALTSIADGQRLNVAAIHPDDAYHDSRGTIVGSKGVNTGLTVTEGCWFGGPFRQEDGEERYFYKAAFTSAGGPAPAPKGCPSGALTSASPGQRVVILKVHPNDAYYSSKSSYEGQTGTVQDVHLQSGSGCYFGGTVKLDNGDEPYFYMAALGRR
jgi:ribosomal protein L21E